MKILLGITMFGCYAMGILVSADHYRKVEVAQTAQTASMVLKSQDCALKASRLANAIDPRLYSESTAERVYKSCLEE